MPATNNNNLATISAPIYGFHRATVIANNDPENRGRVKLFSPSVASHFITRFKLDPGQYVMKFPGDRIAGEKVDELTQKLKKDSQFKTFTLQQLHAVVGVLDWVDQASPLIGSGTIGQLAAPDNLAHISDSPPRSADTEAFAPRRLEVSQPLNTSYPGPVNPHALTNQPAGYINAAKGSFSVPRVGAAVWVFFEEGEVTRPVYFAYSFGSIEGATINSDLHKPHTSENLTTGDRYYTGKTVIANEKGGVIEVVNTDDFEKIRVSDHKGNTIVLSKTGLSLISKSNLDIQVAGDVHQSVGGRYSLKVGGESHTSGGGYGHEYNGDVDKAVVLQKRWLEASQPVRDAFTLPKTRPKHNTTVVKDFKKKTPNNKFCFPKVLNFKLPKGLDPKILLDKINKVLNKINKTLNLPLLLLSGVGEMVSEVMGLLKNPFNFLLTMLGDRIKLLGIKLCNDKKK